MIYLPILLVRGFIDAGNDILKTKAKLVKTTILYSHADTDPINSFKSTSEAYNLTSSKEKELKKWTGLFHECEYYKINRVWITTNDFRSA